MLGTKIIDLLSCCMYTVYQTINDECFYYVLFCKCLINLFSKNICIENVCQIF